MARRKEGETTALARTKKTPRERAEDIVRKANAKAFELAQVKGLTGEQIGVALGLLEGNLERLKAQLSAGGPPEVSIPE